MGLISTLIFGLVAGIIAKLLMPGKDPGGCIITSLLGVVGAFLGKFVSTLVGGSGDVTRWTVSGFVFAVIGAILVLLIYRLIVGRKGPRT